MKVKKKHIGRFVRIQFDDIGADDGIILDVEDHGEYIKYFSLSSRSITTNNGAPAVKIGHYVNAKESGL